MSDQLLERYVTAGELAELMGVSTSTVKRMVAAGMPSETWGMARTRRFLPSAVRAWFDAGGAAIVSDQQRAHARVAALVRTGRLPRPDTLPCARCGHLAADRAHQYHHHRGYAAEHHEDVEPLCTRCHANEHRRRPPA